MDNQQLLQLLQNRARDFLTYLCYRSEAQEGKFELPGIDGTFFLWVDGRIVLEDDSEVPPDTVAYSGDGFSGHELRQALGSGKRVREARFRIEKGENTWLCTVRADRLAVSGLKIDMPPVTDRDEQLYGRLYSVEALNTIIDACYAMFCAAVYADTWQEEGYPAFQEWIAQH